MKTGPSHDIFELINPEDFSKYELARAPDAREHRKRTIDPWAFVSAIVPLPVLLFGATTLRVTCISKIGKVCCFSETQVVVSERFWAPDMHFELKRNIDFCDKISSIFGVMEPVVCALITFLFRNAKRSYQDRTKPWHIGIDQP